MSILFHTPRLAAHTIVSSGAGIKIQSDNSPILRCVFNIGSISANGHAISLVPTVYAISLNNFYFSSLGAGGAGDCVHYDISDLAENNYCGEMMFCGGIVHNGVWAFGGIVGTAKIINVDIENNLYGGIRASGKIICYGLRIEEDMRDLPGPLLKMEGCPCGLISGTRDIDITKIDLTDAQDRYQTEDSSTRKILYTNRLALLLENGVTNSLYMKEDGTPEYHYGAVLGWPAVVVGKKILIRNLPEVRRVITEEIFDLSANAVDYNTTKMIPTIYEAGTALSAVRLHPSFASFAHPNVTVIQTDEQKIVLYDCEGHLIFDGTAYGAGTFLLKAFHDYDDNAGINYAVNLPLIDYSREKWTIEKEVNPYSE